mmetsp:Transcript_17659/g.40908  ORF Transcript_17659/g.40908 Transcript_17659/m.40908 type:complete len:236 (-) Transcript_17659:109-816(-)
MSSECRVFVGNLDWKITQAELKTHMEQVGDVAKADIFEERNGRSKGCAVVEYVNPEDAKACLEKLNDSTLGERPIFVREDRDGPKGDSKGKGYSGGKGKGKSDYGGGKGWKGDDDDYYGGGKSKGKSKKEGKKGGDSFGGGGGGGKGSSKSQDRAGRLVYAGNLPFRTSWQDLKDVFKAYGEVQRVEVAQDYDGRSKGYATILFEREEDAQTAIDALHESDFQGRKMLVRMDNYA